MFSFLWRKPEMSEEKNQNSTKLTPEAVAPLANKIAKLLINRIRQELIGESDTLIENSIKKVTPTIVRKAYNTSQNWCKWNDNGPVLMPDFARLYYRKGNTEVLVIEYSPQIRFMRFDSRLARPGAEIGNKTYNYSLAMPYMVFMHRYINGAYKDSYLAFNDRPLRKLDEKPLRPYLPNIAEDLKICLGQQFDNAKLEKGNIVQQAAYVISHFWQTTYTHELAQHYMTYKQHFKSDQRLSSLEGWQEASVNNPLFVIEDVNWLSHYEESFGDMIVRLFEEDAKTQHFNQDLFTETVETATSEITKVINNSVKEIEGKLGKYTPEIQKVLIEEMNKLIS